ncbi:PaaI family thioesterase [Massilia sp. MB5]|uniref:PaaI family thioesterase n=1 Tax=Massilia sp. MB5 TaxID=2919578 RepID=UPI001F0D76DD|nr:PaaI family thioesterase [Massilia sp. MB5]UMR30709.1 PaaI family thioesterase [Massilia sp. MB5]
MTTLLASLPDLNRVLEGARFLAGYDFKVTACAPGECELLVPFKPELERPGGIVSGMTIMGAADVAMWLAIKTLRGMEEHWVTSDMKTAFLRAGIGEPLLCKARVLRMGRCSAYGSVETFGQAGSLLAHHVVSYARASEPASRAAPPGAPQ